MVNKETEVNKVTNTLDTERANSGQSWQWVGGKWFRSGIRHIMVPTDLTSESDRAIEFGIGLAKQLGAHLTLLHVYQDPYYVMGYALGPQAGETAPELRNHFAHALESLAKNVQKEYAQCEIEFRDGVPCAEIVSAAKERDVDLIVISTHQYNFFARMAFGCDAEHIVRDAPCPVLVLNP